VGHRRTREHPQAGLCQGPCYLGGCISVKHLYWCTWLNLRQGWHTQSSSSPIVSLNTHRHAPASPSAVSKSQNTGAACLVPRPLSGSSFFRFRKSIERMALAGRSKRSSRARQNWAPLYAVNESAWVWLKRVESGQLRMSSNHKLPRIFQTFEEPST
jgi:hypothetical protein